jgi:ubiquinone/menaquinone biosynthesis C-methylase UbiE
MNSLHQKFFDRAASDWDLMFTAEDLDRLRHIIQRLEIKTGMNVLDLGCGTGILFDLSRREVGTSGFITGVDFSLKMACQARRNFPFPNVGVIDADASCLPFAENAFDMAIAFSSFPHFADQRKALAELHRVLKPGATVHIIHLVSSAQLKEIHHRVGGAVEHDRLPSERELRAMLADAGFAEIEIDDEPNLYLARAVNT